MTSKYENPFKFGVPVSSAFYYDRSQLKKAILSLLNNQMSVVLLGPRRYGKTSFLKNLMSTSSKETTVYIDLFNITSHRDFLRQLLMALNEVHPLWRQVSRWIKDLPKKVRPNITFESDQSTGFISPSLSFESKKLDDEEIKDLIVNTFQSLKDEKIWFFFDEFQVIRNLNDKMWLESTLRTVMQKHKKCSFLYTGSQREMIHNMFNAKEAPFFRSSQLIEFPPLDQEFNEWAVTRFKKGGVVANEEDINFLRHKVQDCPNYVQMVGYHIVAQGEKKISEQVIMNTIKSICLQNSYSYQNLLMTNSPVHQRVLKMAASLEKMLFSKDALAKYDIKSASHVSQALRALTQKRIIDEISFDGTIIFDDPLFAIWLRFL